MEDGQEQVAVSDQTTDQTPADDQQAAPVDQTPANDDHMYVRVPRSNYEKYAPDGDFNKVIHAAKELHELRQGGFVDMATQIREANMDGYQFLSAWNQPEDDPQYQQEPQQQQQQQYPPQDQPLTQADFQRMQDELRQERLYEQQQHQYQQQMQQARQAETGFYGSQLDTLGYNANPEKVSIAGTWKHRLSGTSSCSPRSSQWRRESTSSR